MAVARGVPRQKLVYGYDWMSRRVSKTVSNYVAGAWQLSTGHRFVYDGWNLVGEVNQSNVLERTHVWGLDASGTMQGLPREIRRLGHVCRLNLSDLCRSCSCGGDHFISRGEGQQLLAGHCQAGNPVGMTCL